MGESVQDSQRDDVYDGRDRILSCDQQGFFESRGCRVAHEAYAGAKNVDRDYGDYPDDRATNSVEERGQEL